MTGPVSAAEIAAAVRRGETTATAICEQTLATIADGDTTLHAFLHVSAEHALQQAREVDAARAGGDCGPLCGVPVALKDNLCTAGMPTTAGSRILEGFIPPYDATTVARLRRAGAVIVGKTNCDEFAMGSSTEHSAFGPTRNPHAADAAPGGSSGGSAAAVAAGMVPIALGSDTGGSIRQPAAFCGVLGLKPTYGRVSRYGLIAFASSLDQVGPFGRDARDVALVLGVIAGADHADATCSRRSVPDYVGVLSREDTLEGVRVGVPRDALADGAAGLDADVQRAFDDSLRDLSARGATIVDVTLPHSTLAIAVYYLIATAEASSNLARYDGVRYGRRVSADDLLQTYERTRAEGFGPEVKRRLILGTFALSAGYYDAYYLKAQQVRTLIARDFHQAFARADVIAMPTAPTPAFRLGERTEDPLQMYLADVFTVGVSLAGLPAVSVPCGRSKTGLPIGLQLIGRPFEEAELLRVAEIYQRHTPDHASYAR